MRLFQAGKRRASGYEESLYYDELCFPCRVAMWDAPPGAVVLDCGSVVLSGTDHRETGQVAQGVECLAVDEPGLRAVVVPGADGKRYLLIANFGDGTIDVQIPMPAGVHVVVDPVTREDGWMEGERLYLNVKSGAAHLFVLE